MYPRQGDKEIYVSKSGTEYLSIPFHLTTCVCVCVCLSVCLCVFINNIVRQKDGSTKVERR